MTEKQLIRRCQQQDRGAQQILYETYASKMFGICYRYVCDRELARDLMHDGFITVYQKIGDFRGEGAFEGWMRRIFVNTALGHLRRHNVLNDAKPFDGTGQFDERESSIVERMAAAEIVKHIEKLPNGYRIVLNLYAVEGFSHREIAEQLQISEGTSRSQLNRAKSYLWKLLKEAEII